MHFVLYAVGLAGICYLVAHCSKAAADEPAEPSRQDWKPRSRSHVENGDPLDWTVTLLVVVCYVSLNWLLLTHYPRREETAAILRAFALPIPLAVFAVTLTLQLHTSRPSWAGMFVITLGLLTVGAFNLKILIWH